MSKTFSKVSTKTSMSVFPRLFLFYRIFGCFSPMGVQKHYKKRFSNKIVSKSFKNKIDQKSKSLTAPGSYRHPRRFAPRPDTQRRSSGHRNTLAAHKLPACNSWRCSLIYAHPRGPRLPPAFGPKKAPALTPACESA